MTFRHFYVQILFWATVCIDIRDFTCFKVFLIKWEGDIDSLTMSMHSMSLNRVIHFGITWIREYVI